MSHLKNIKKITGNVAFQLQNQSSILIENCYMESEVANIKAWQMRGTMTHCKLYTDIGYGNIQPNSYIVLDDFTIKNCEFVNDFNDPDACNIKLNYSIDNINMKNNIFFCKGNYNMQITTYVGSNIYNVLMNKGVSDVLTSSFKPLRFFAVLDPNNIHENDVYDIWITPFLGDARNHDSSSARQITYTVQAGDTEESVIKGIVNAWNAAADDDIANDNYPSLLVDANGDKRFNLVIIKGEIGEPVNRTGFAIGIEGRNVFDWLPNLCGSDCGMTPSQPNFTEVVKVEGKESRYYLGLFNKADIDNENKTIIISKYLMQSNMSASGENNNIQK